jgi:uncharacterized phage infection (PIP) family protein YhgE
MEILDLHTQFEELVSEMQTLRGATALIEDNAKSSDAVVAQGEELLGAATILLQQASGTVARAADELTSEAATLQSLQSEVRTALSALDEAARTQAERIEAMVKQGLDEQISARQAASEHLREATEALVRELEEAGQRSRERLDQVHAGVVQLTKAQRSVSAEVKSGFATAAQRRADQAEKAQEAQKAVVSEYHVQLAQSLAARIDRMEAVLVEQGRMNLDGIHARGGELSALTRKAVWASVGFVALQAGVLVLCFWYFL